MEDAKDTSNGLGPCAKLRLALMCAAFAAVAWGFQTLLLSHAPSVFADPKEDMSFGWYVPLFALYVVWTERKALREAAGGASWAGTAALLPFLAIGFLGTRGIQVRFEMLAFAGLSLAIPWAFWGGRVAKKMLFPSLFLLFCIPLASFLDIVTVHLRLFASSAAYELLRGFGAEVVRRGTMLAAADGSFEIDVAEPCSGLRSIFALMALTAGYAYFNQPTWLRRALLFATSVPLAILGNVARILSICLVANFASPDFATGFYHDYSGYVVFVVAILLMVAAGELITRVAGRLHGGGRKESDADGTTRAARRGVGGAAPAFAALALIVPAMLYQAATPEVTVAEPPEIHLGEIPGYDWKALEPSEAELTILPADTTIEKRMYTARSGDWFQVSLVIGGKSKSSIHRPELCLPAQGFLMTDPRTATVDGTEWRFITVRSPDGAIGFAYTFLNQEGYRTASHVKRIFRDTWDRSVLNRIDRWAMVTINAARADDASLSDIARRLRLDKAAAGREK